MLRKVKLFCDIAYLPDENKALQTLLKEREIEAAEVVSVNLGKLKKRIKKPTEVALRK
jgi:hypothetical protein